MFRLMLLARRNPSRRGGEDCQHCDHARDRRKGPHLARAAAGLVRQRPFNVRDEVRLEVLALLAQQSPAIGKVKIGQQPLLAAPMACGCEVAPTPINAPRCDGGCREPRRCQRTNSRARAQREMSASWATRIVGA